MASICAVVAGVCRSQLRKSQGKLINQFREVFRLMRRNEVFQMLVVLVMFVSCDLGRRGALSRVRDA